MEFRLLYFFVSSVILYPKTKYTGQKLPVKMMEPLSAEQHSGAQAPEPNQHLVRDEDHDSLMSVHNRTQTLRKKGQLAVVGEITIILATSAARLAGAPEVGMYDVGKEPTSACAPKINNSPVESLLLLLSETAEKISG